MKRKTGVRILAGVLALLLALALVVGSLLSVRAAESDGYRLRFTGSSAAGDTLYMYLDMTGVESVSALQILVTYDDKQLTLTSAATGDALSGMMTALNDTVSGQLKMGSISVSEVTPNGVILEAEFTVNSSVSAGDEISASVEIQESYLSDLTANPAMGMTFTTTITAGESAAQSDSAGITQTETASKSASSASGSTATSSSGAAATTSSSAEADESAAADADTTTSLSTTENTGSAAVGDESENKWIIPAAILLVAAVVIVVLFFVFRPMEKAEETAVEVEENEFPEVEAPETVEKSNKSDSDSPQE